MSESYEQKLAELRSRPITITGATPEEIMVIRAALNLYRTRSVEKNTAYLGMGYDIRAQLAQELEIRIL